MDHADYDRVVNIAELFLNHLEHIAAVGNNFGKEDRPALERFCSVAFERSPILRRQVVANRNAYSDALHRLVPTREAARPTERSPEVSISKDVISG